MIQIRPWKVALVALAFVFGLVFTLPNLLPASVTAKLPAALAQRLNLGLDLQGGSYLLLEVDTDALHQKQLSNLVDDARRTLQTANIGFTDLGVNGDQVQVRIDSPAQIASARAALAKLSQPLAGGGADLTVATGPNQTLALSYSPQAVRTTAAGAVTQSIEIIRNRIDQLGTREPTILQQGLNRIVVEAPGESDPERLKTVIGQTAALTFQMVDEAAHPDADGNVPPEDELVQSQTPDKPGNEPLVLRRHVVLTGAMLTDAHVAFDPQSGQPVVAFRLNGAGALAFAQVTQANVGQRFAIVLDNKYVSAPRIDTPILGGSGQITGSFTPQSASDFALILRSGALPTKLIVEEQRQVGAELGADAVHAGALALSIGAIAIFIFIIAAYGLFGVFAACALMVNGLLIVALMSLTQGTLTLPGIAGLILTLAVAVDANVLIYERMRDEARAGRPPILAADNGFRRAMVTILDANVTTLIAAAIMFQFGSGEVKGFALTLAIGVCTSVFTAVLITQVLIGWWFRTARPKSLPIV
jgi:preprotein translocase subunit SecD